MRRRITVLLKKELTDLVGRRVLLLTTLLLPLLFMIVMPFSVGFGLPALLGEKVFNDPDLDKAVEALLAFLPDLAGLDRRALFQILILRQFTTLALLAPILSAMTIATYSIVGEKVSRSLEPLLVTPITTAELLLSKSLAAAVPAIGASWASFGLFAAGVFALAPAPVFQNVINSTTLVIFFVMGPLIAVLALSLGIIASSRSSDPRSAQQISVVVILPLVAIVVSQLFGLFFLTVPLVLGAAAAIAAVDLAVLKIGVALFERESILTRWK